MSKVLIKLMILLSFISCGKNALIQGETKTITVYSVEEAAPEDYTYELMTDDCTTGPQAFKTFINACKGLTNHELNNQCALEERQELFENEECPGEFAQEQELEQA